MFAFPQLNLPIMEHKIRSHGESDQILDPLRRKYIKLTPEEWVRQNFIQYLIRYKGYPIGLLGNEISLELYGTKRRCDSVLFGTDCLPRMIMEYKAPHIPLTQKVFDQICNYNRVFKTPWLILSNGMQHTCCQIDIESGNFKFLSTIPSYEQLG